MELGIIYPFLGQKVTPFLIVLFIYQYLESIFQ